MLTDKTILITRQQQQNSELCRYIEQLGGKCIVFPTINITDPDDWSDCDDALHNLDSFDWVVLSSINAVRSFFKRVQDKQIQKFDGQIATVGDKTRKTVLEYGWRVDLVPELFSAEGILDTFKAYDLHNKKILLPASNVSRQELGQGLEAQGAHVRKVITYKTECNKPETADDITQALLKNQIDAILFFSPSAVRCFKENLQSDAITHIAGGNILIGAIGKTTAEAVAKTGWIVQVIPEKSTQEKLVQSVSEFFNTKTEHINA